MTDAAIPVVTLGAPDALPPPIAAHAAARFNDSGVLVLKNLYAADRVTELHDAYRQAYGAIDHTSKGVRIKEVGDKRQMITLDVAGAFASPDVMAHPAALSIVAALLDDDFILGSYVAVTSMAGAAAQRLHADQNGLFGIDALDASVPCYSVTLVIPLVPLDPVTGSTRFQPGTHRAPETATENGGIAPALDLGDAVLFDSRIMHGGQPNRSDAQRPVIYCTYQRAWYRDVSNHRDMPAMILDAETLAGMDDRMAALVDWTLPERDRS